jgi:TolA-binding protein
MYEQGDAAMKVGSFDDAITQFKSILKRYPDTQTRYRAQFRLAEALSAQRRDNEALALLQSVVKEDNAVWSPEALERIGDVYAAQLKYTEAFRAYRQVIAAYPDSPQVDHAYFAIGATHFKLGHFAIAAEQLGMVGTAYAARDPRLQKVSPGEPLTIKLDEPNTVASKGQTISVVVTSTSGDREAVVLIPEIEGGERFTGSIETRMALAKPGDGVMELNGGDKVTLTYNSRYVGAAAGAAQIKTAEIGVASNARLAVRDASGAEVAGVVVSDTAIVEVNDPDRDKTSAPDTVVVQLTTRRGDKEQLTLTETGPRTGVFQARVVTASGAPVVGNGRIESAVGTPGGPEDDMLNVSYVDEFNLVGQGQPRTIKTAIGIYPAGTATESVPKHDINDASVDIKAMLLRGQSQGQIARTYRDLGADAKAAASFQQAQDQFRDLMRKYPNAPEVQDALYGLFDTYLGQDRYDSAIGVVAQITKKYPESARASEALFKLADLHIKHQDYEQGLAIYQSLIQRAPGTPLAENAQYAICTTYLDMYRPKATSLTRLPITRQDVIKALDTFTRAYPTSERAPDAAYNLVKLRYDGGDYLGAIDAAKRATALFPDNVVTGRILIIEAQSQYRTKDLVGAKETLELIIANYGSEADQATRLLADVKAGPDSSTGVVK